MDRCPSNQLGSRWFDVTDGVCSFRQGTLDEDITTIEGIDAVLRDGNDLQGAPVSDLLFQLPRHAESRAVGVREADVGADAADSVGWGAVLSRAFLIRAVLPVPHEQLQSLLTCPRSFCSGSSCGQRPSVIQSRSFPSPSVISSPPMPE